MKAQGVDGSRATVRSVVVGTAGHIDHGKTALVLALTGTDTDRLPEEKVRGITIDLGFAALELVGPTGEQIEVSLIDVPGHQAFVRNMLAGAGGIDCVLLVVAADEGVKPQTEEHLAICRLLGIARGLVALTKADAVGPERLLAARGELAGLVEGTFLEGAPVVAVSARTGQGIGELKAALARTVAGVSPRSEERVMRLPVDRVFSVRGFGTVVTGTLQAGGMRAGESLTLEPARRAVRVRGVQVHGKARAGVSAPNRVALNLAGVEVGEVRRGDMVVPAGTLEPVGVVDVAVEVLPGAALRHRQRVRVHAFASESLATVLLYEDQGVGGQLARLRLVQPMLLVPGDRFVLRQPSPAATIGGGRVLDAHPLLRLKKAAVAAWLRELRGAGPAEVMRLRVRRQGWVGIRLDRLVGETGWNREAVRRWVDAGVREGSVVLGAGGEAAIGTAALAEVEERLLQEMGRGKGGVVAQAELRGRVGVEDWVFALASDRLRAAGRAGVRGEALALPGNPKSAGLDGPAAKVEQLYRAAGLASPIASEAAEKLRMGAAELRGAVTALLRTGSLLRMGSDALLVHAEAVERLRTELQNHRGESFDVPRFKSFTGLTRKHAIPLLEYLDGARVMRNVGGVRVVI